MTLLDGGGILNGLLELKNKILVMVIKSKTFLVTFISVLTVCMMTIFANTAHVNAKSNSLPQTVHKESGLLDFSTWDFQGAGNVKLDGQWEFYPNQLLTVEEMMDPTLKPPHYIEVPKGWSNENSSSFMHDKGAGTYRIKVKVDPNITMYGLKSTYIRNASTIYINGQIVGNSGVPAMGFDQGYVSRNVPITAFFPPNDGQLIITIHVANWDYYYGGIIQSIYLGTQHQILDQVLRANVLDALGFSFFLLSFIYYLSIYFRRPQDKGLLYFTIFSLLYTFVIFTSNERLFMQLVPAIPYMIVLKLRMFVIGICLPFLCLFVREMERSLIPQKFSKFTFIAMVSVAISGLFVPVQHLGTFESYAVWIYLMSLLSIAGLLLKAIIKRQYGKLRRPTVWLLFSVIMLLFIQFIFMVLYLYSIINTAIVPILTVVLFLIGIATLFANQYKGAYDKLEVVSHQLIEADKMKDEFLIHTSHEFKTPLHGIINLAQVVINHNGDRLEHKQQENIAFIISQATRLSTLVNDIIDFQSLQQGRLTFQNQLFDISGTVQATLEVLKYLRKGDHVQLISKVEQDTYFLYTDENRFKQILVNLVGNALKFTEQGSIEVSAQLKAGEIIIHFTDTGAGMSEERQQKLFTDELLDDHQEETQVNSQYRSSGLGLKISRMLAQQMGGNIDLKWSEIGKGTQFELKLPAATAQQHAEQASSIDGLLVVAASGPSLQGQIKQQEQPVVQSRLRQVRQAKQIRQAQLAERINETKQVNDELLSKEKQQRNQTSSVPTNQSASKIKILIVDDEASNIKVLQELFARSGYQMLIAYNGISALELLQNHRDVSLVLLDVMMPGISGYEVCKRIRENYPIYKLPIVLLTVRNSSADVAVGLEAGANDFLVKPFDGKELMARVQTLLQLKEAAEQAIQMEALFLQSQIKPHFIYNALSSIISLCYSDGMQAGKLLMEFSNYLRLSFDLDPHHSKVSLERELSLVRSYVALEQSRFDERLRVEWDINVKTPMDIPALTIQPLVENSIQHGLMKRIAGGSVKISLNEQADHIMIVVQDDGVGMSPEKLSTILAAEKLEGSIGLLNVHRRLIYEYGQGLEVESEEGVGTKISFKLPIIVPSQ